MSVENNKVVHFHYVLSEANGPIIESSYDDNKDQSGEPMACLVGYNNILAALEQAMLGKDIEDEFDVDLSPDQAYGPLLPESVMRVSKKHVLNKGKLTVGMAVKINTDKGPRDVRVVKVGKFSVDVDTNHPLAGKQLKFAIKIIGIRDATAEELAHRHVHGDGGHHH